MEPASRDGASPAADGRPPIWDVVLGLYGAVLTDYAQVFGGEQVFKSLEEQAELARGFTRGMHSISMGPALAWPDVVDLSRHRLMLDVGGGSGAHSIGALLR
jgi:O-methyltransferase domain